MSENQRTLTANFTADTSGFSPKVNELIQKLKVLNQDFEQNKSKVKELSSQLKAYETELKKLNTATDGGAKATDEQKARMQALRDSIAACNVQIGTYKAAQGQLRSQINSTNKELSDQQHALNETDKALSEAADSANDFNALIQKIEELNQSFKHNNTEIKSLSARLKEYRAELDKLNADTVDGAHASSEQKQRMKQLREGINACTIQIRTYEAEQAKLGSQLISTSNDLNKQNKVFDETEDVLGEVGGELSETSDSLDKMSNALQGAGQGAATFGDVLKANLAADFIKNSIRELVDLLRQAAAYCYQVGSSFEAGMSQVAAVSGASGAELEQLTAKAKELGASTKFTATETAEALNYMAMAGWKTEEMLDGIDGVLSLAAASGADLGTTSDIVTDALTAFGMTAADCSHFADVLAAASSNANTNVTMMGETFKYCAPIAGALGFSAEDTAVAIGLMANSGIKASQAGTALRTIMTKLSSDVKISGEKIGEVVVQTKNADGSMRGLSDIVNDLRTAFSGLSESEQSAAAKNIAGAEAMSGFLAIMNVGEADVRKLALAIDNCSGAASAMAETMQENLSGAVTIFNSALEGVGIAVYDKFKDALTDTVNIFTECLSEMTDEIDNNGALGESIESLADSFRDAAKEIAVLVKDLLPGFINLLSNALNFVVDFRKEISGAAAAFIALKSGMAIKDVLSAVAKNFNILKAAIKGAISTSSGLRGVVGNVNSLTSATNAATTAQNGLNAASKAFPWGLIAAGIGVVVGGIVDIASHIETAEERLRALRSASDEAARSAEEHAQKAENLRDLKERYDEIYSSEKTAEEKGQDLKTLQEQLIDLAPDLKGKIDLVTGAYREQADVIQDVIDKQSEAAKSDSIVAYNEMKKADEEEVKKTISFYAADNPAMKDERVKKVMEKFLYDNYNPNLKIDTSVAGMGNYKLEISSEVFSKANSLEEIRTALENAGLASAGGDISDFYNEIASKAKEYRELADQKQSVIDAFNYYNYGITPQKNEPAETDLEQRKRIYEEERKAAEESYSAGEMGAGAYYNTLEALRDKYFKHGESEWAKATERVEEFYKSWRGEASTASESAKSSCDDVQSAYKKMLAAIDAEYEKHKRAKSDSEFQSKINEIDKELQYGRVDEFERYELAKRRKKLIADHNEELYSRGISDLKSGVTDAYNAKKALAEADSGTKEYTLALTDYTDKLAELNATLKGLGGALGINGSSVSNIDESVKNNYINVILQAVSKSNGQLVDEIMKALHSGI